jgi:hypothetical protein
METKNSAPMATGSPFSAFARNHSKQDRLYVRIVLFWAILLLPFWTMAQSSSQIDVNEYGYKVTVPNVILDAGETVDIQLELGKNGEVVEHGMGFRFTIELSANADLTPSLSPSLDGSWIHESGVGLQESHGEGGNNEYVIRYDRDSPVDGSGRTLTLTLKSAVNDVSAASLLSQSGGVLVVDNLDIRQAAPTTDSEIQVYPNPTNGVFQVRCGDEPAQQVQILSVNGQVLRSFSANQQLDITDLSPGFYYVQICNQLNRASRHLSLQKF